MTYITYRTVTSFLGYWNQTALISSAALQLSPFYQTTEQLSLSSVPTFRCGPFSHCQPDSWPQTQGCRVSCRASEWSTMFLFSSETLHDVWFGDEVLYRIPMLSGLLFLLTMLQLDFWIWARYVDLQTGHYPVVFNKSFIAVMCNFCSPAYQ